MALQQLKRLGPNEAGVSELCFCQTPEGLRKPEAEGVAPLRRGDGLQPEPV